MRLATWNVSSNRSRLSRLLDFLPRREPDVVCLQQPRASGDELPGDVPRAAGYRSAAHGQRTYNGVAILSHGQAVGTPAFSYRLRWLERLREYLDRHHLPEPPLVLCGDFDVAPEDRDVHDPAAWCNQVLCHPEERARLSQVSAWGLTDAFRQHQPEAGHFTWWDYRMLSFAKNRGRRIDHIFVSAPVARRTRTSLIDRDERKGEKPSSHAAVLVEIGEVS
jgi:exodeoxyribonuclease-3